MTRTITGATQAALAGARVTSCHLLEIEWPGQTTRLTDAGVSLSWGGYTWLASQFLGFSDYEEQLELFVPRLTVSLSGVDQSIISILLQHDFFNRRARIRKAALTDALAVIVDPCLLIDGHMDKPVIAINPADGTCTASVDIVSLLDPIDSLPGRHTNHDEQQRWFPGDLGFQEIPRLPRTIFWGKVFRVLYGRALRD